MGEIKKLTILHSNDMHGDFMPAKADGKETGGLTRLSGYVNKVRKERDNVIYAIAGDMFRGSIIDSEYKGLSTIDLVNCLAPDVATIGNHEVDYGIGHLLFLEKCARFPIINANMYATMNDTRMFRPYINLDVGGMRILFIGVLTEETLALAKKENIIGTYIDIENAVEEIGIICDNYRTVNTDMVVLLTHIGIEQDRKLAEMLLPDWHVDMIIGGHSHTFMTEPEYVQGIPIVQAGTGTDVIGRFEVEYDVDEKKIASLKWRCDPINEDTAPEDPVMKGLLDSYRTETDRKYRKVVTRWARKLTHPARTQETEMGNLYADAMQSRSSFDIMMLGSGTIRKTEMGPIIKYQDILENTPFDDGIWMVEVTGAQFRRMILHIMRDEAWTGHTEFYQFSKDVRIVYRKSTHTIEELKYKGEDIGSRSRLKIALLTFHYLNFDEFLGVPLKEIAKNMEPVCIASSVINIITEYFATNRGLDARVEGRIEILE